MSHRSLLPALLAAILTTPAVVVSTPAAAAVEEQPLHVTLDGMRPSVVPDRGPLRLRGTVTNTTDETWYAVNVYPFGSWNTVAPVVVRDADQLAAEVRRGTDEFVGARWTEDENYRTIPEIEPGETHRWSARITAEQLAGARGPGVYWVGAHALGESDSTPRDEFADGRARTFVPRVPDDATAVDTALVLPVRHRVQHAPDGSMDNVPRWAEDLADGGRLADLVAFGAEADVPVTWLVDPAVTAAADRLAEGNPGRSLDPTEEDPSVGSATPSPSPADPGTAGPTPDEGEVEDEPTPEELRAAGVARTWLERARGALEGDEVLALPYGDLDVDAAVAHDPDWLRRARRLAGEGLAPWGLAAAPAVGPPNGAVLPETLEGLAEGATVLVDDRMFPGADVAGPVTVSGHQVVVADSSATAGGPGPDDPFGAVALRQQVLAEAALRALAGDDTPLVAVLPSHWQPPAVAGRARAFFAGLDLDWVRPVTLSAVVSRPSPGVPVDEARPPEAAPRRTVPVAVLDAAARLAEAGRVLDRVLFRTDAVAEQVLAEALPSTSYWMRARPRKARARADRARADVAARLAGVTLEPPQGVTLSSDTGEFGVTVVNGTDQPVEVRLEASTDGQVEISSPDPVQLQAGDRTTVFPTASTDVLGQHDALLRLTDVEGNPLGASAVVPIRANQVSRVIWVVIGLGMALLFSAILVRLFRRVREAVR